MVVELVDLMVESLDILSAGKLASLLVDSKVVWTVSIMVETMAVLRVEGMAELTVVVKAV